SFEFPDLATQIHDLLAQGVRDRGAVTDLFLKDGACLQRAFHGRAQLPGSPYSPRADRDGEGKDDDLLEPATPPAALGATLGNLGVGRIAWPFHDLAQQGHRGIGARASFS